MITTRTLGFALGLLTAVALSPLALAGEKRATSEAEIDGATSKIKWGQHWAGPELKGAKSLEGKVVLLKIWGG